MSNCLCLVLGNIIGIAASKDGFWFVMIPVGALPDVDFKNAENNNRMILRFHYLEKLTQIKQNSCDGLLPEKS